MTDAEALESLMSRGYVALAMGKEDVTKVIADYDAALEDHPALPNLAAETYSQLNSLPKGKCFISQTRADFLRRVLNQ